MTNCNNRISTIQAGISTHLPARVMEYAAHGTRNSKNSSNGHGQQCSDCQGEVAGVEVGGRVGGDK